MFFIFLDAKVLFHLLRDLLKCCWPSFLPSLRRASWWSSSRWLAISCNLGKILIAHSGNIYVLVSSSCTWPSHHIQYPTLPSDLFTLPMISPGITSYGSSGPHLVSRHHTLCFGCVSYALNCIFDERFYFVISMNSRHPTP